MKESSTAFTLVEIMIVVAIIALIVSITVSIVQKRSFYRSTATKELVTAGAISNSITLDDQYQNEYDENVIVMSFNKYGDNEIGGEATRHHAYIKNGHVVTVDTLPYHSTKRQP